MSKKKIQNSNLNIIISAIIGGLILFFILNSYNNNSTQNKKEEQLKKFNKGKEEIEKLMKDNSKK